VDISFHFVWSNIRCHIDKHKLTLRSFYLSLPPSFRTTFSYDRFEEDFLEDRLTPNHQTINSNLALTVLKITNPYFIQTISPPAVKEAAPAATLSSSFQTQGQGAQPYRKKIYGKFNEWADVAYTVMYHWRNGINAEEIFQKMMGRLGNKEYKKLSDALPEILSSCFDDNVYLGSKKIAPDRVKVPADVFKEYYQAELQRISNPIAKEWGRILDVFTQSIIISDPKGLINGQFVLSILEQIEQIQDEEDYPVTADRLPITTENLSPPESVESSAPFQGRFRLPDEFRIIASARVSIPDNLSEIIKSQKKSDAQDIGRSTTRAIKFGDSHLFFREQFRLDLLKK
jgi:hypothetical protein